MDRDAMTSYILIGFVASLEDKPKPFMALTWPGEECSTGKMELVVRKGWESLVPESQIGHLSGIIEDWKERIKTEPKTIARTASELFGGHLRAMRHACVTAEAARKALKHYLRPVS